MSCEEGWQRGFQKTTHQNLPQTLQVGSLGYIELLYVCMYIYIYI